MFHVHLEDSYYFIPMTQQRTFENPLYMGVFIILIDHVDYELVYNAYTIPLHYEIKVQANHR